MNFERLVVHARREGLDAGGKTFLGGFPDAVEIDLFQAEASRQGMCLSGRGAEHVGSFEGVSGSAKGFGSRSGLDFGLGILSHDR